MTARTIARHAAPGIALVLLALWLSWAPLVVLLLALCSAPTLLRRARRQRRDAELRAAKALYFGPWADRIDPVWLPQDVKQWLTTRPKLLGFRSPGSAPASLPPPG